MKRGDLVKLVLPGNTARWPAGVVVSWQRDFGVADATLATRFPEGTLAVFLSNEAGTPCVFLGATSSPNDEYTVSSVLIEGRVGWVWSRYLEAL